MTDLVAEIRSHLLDYLANRTSLEEFEGWLVAESADRVNLTADRLAGEIKLRLDEYKCRHLTRNDLDRELRHILLAGVPSSGPSFVFLPVSTISYTGSKVIQSDVRTLEFAGK